MSEAAGAPPSSAPGVCAGRFKSGRCIAAGRAGTIAGVASSARAACTPRRHSQHARRARFVARRRAQRSLRDHLEGARSRRAGGDAVLACHITFQRPDTAAPRSAGSARRGPVRGASRDGPQLVAGAISTGARPAPGDGRSAAPPRRPAPTSAPATTPSRAVICSPSPRNRATSGTSTCPLAGRRR
jgi:hypothetical protein